MTVCPPPGVSECSVWRGWWRLEAAWARILGDGDPQSAAASTRLGWAAPGLYLLYTDLTPVRRQPPALATTSRVICEPS